MNRKFRKAAQFAPHSASIIAMAAAMLAAPAFAQDAAPAAKPGEETVVVVTGYRASLQKSLNVKRRSDIMLDAINAEDIGKFPESNLAEALQRLPGISIERDNGEGRTITVRGLGGDFVRTRLNGIETLATTGVNEGQSGLAKSRGFDYNVFASELFSGLRVLKSAESTVDEGSLGATIDIDTAHPLDFRKQKIVFSIQDNYFVDDKKHNPRIAGLYSNTWFGNRLGFSISGAYTKRDTGLSIYNRNPGQFEFNYRGSDLAGPVKGDLSATPKPTCLATSGAAPTVNTTVNSSPLNCYWGFALPTNLRTAGLTSLGIDSNSMMFGSDPTAYAALPVDAIMPTLLTLQQQELHQKRIGLTSSLQWKPTEKTKVTLDVLYGQLNYDTQQYQLGSFGLNRHGDVARAEIGLTDPANGLRPFAAGNFNYFTDRRGAYGNACLPRAATATQSEINCTGTLGTVGVPVFSTAQYWNGSAYVLTPSVLGTTASNGNTWSTNPYNLDTYDYYNNPGSVGYSAALAAADHRGIANYDQIVGKEHAGLMDVHIGPNGQVDYMKINKMDWDSNDAYAINQTLFTQYDFTIDQVINDQLKMKFVYGASFSKARLEGGRVDMYALDQDGYVWDSRQGGTMPIFQTGYNAADPTKYGDIVKGYASTTRYTGANDNRYQNMRIEFNYVQNDLFSYDFGFSKREYGFKSTAASVGNSVLPTIKEFNKYGTAQGKSDYANLKMSDLGQVVTWGTGLDLPAGTITQWWAPSRDKFFQYLGYNCNCVNAFGDFRLVPTLGSGLTVNESDSGTYGQVNFKLPLLGRTLRGNTGVRVVTTKITSSSYGTTGVLNGVLQTGSNEYTDTLPSANFNYEITDNLLVRFAAAKTMARPSLGLLGPGVTSLSIGALPDNGANIPSVTLGNPALKPYRSTNYDLNVEWYFTKDAQLSVAFFQKNLRSYPRVESRTAKLSDVIAADQMTQIRNSLTPVQQAYMDSTNEWKVTTAADSPGGVVNGIELQYQQPLTFLPAPFDGFGIQANATHIQSKLSYLSQAGVRATAPWPFASPHTLNVTLYYEKGPWEARVSGSWREQFASRFPQAEGTCPPGLLTNNGGVCNAPYNAFSGARAQTYWDFKGTYAVNSHVKLDLAVQNVTSEDPSGWVYDTNTIQDYRSGAGTIVATAIRFNY
jgi:TonB-dependent receptor